MTSEPAADAVAALIIQMADQAERITGVSARVKELGAAVARQGTIIDALDGIDTHVAILARHVTKLAGADDDNGDRYQPVPPPRWWKLDERARNAAIGRLRAWVEDIYRPGYGHLAAMLPACWESHPACLYLLDWLSELWSVLYLSPQRTAVILAAQAEWQTRLLPAAAEQMAIEASRCRHADRRRPPSPAGPETPVG